MKKKIVVKFALPLIITAGLLVVCDFMKTCKKFTINHDDFSDYGDSDD